MSVYERMEDGSLRTAIPEPYWVKRWWTLFRWRPACWNCKTVYWNKQDYCDHFATHHLNPED